ncbi:hypothetical protein M404DRAFT_166663 [Pisolithus tinctorius Marx 270]|uniref:Tc1-like transposase DDE domain-containing protein n=1 Tax=Pisolithus tinctorius Marx 270 TaxID=870435 RepID=A0A0C3NHF0_PISTI|nr:hypothetical protein M404DRAFT_166663 [Pisolithus tinctorius Marx 270]
MQLLYLPPYSPDFNPIKEAFSAMKAWICQNHDYARVELSGDLSSDPYQLIVMIHTLFLFFSFFFHLI